MINNIPLPYFLLLFFLFSSLLFPQGYGTITGKVLDENNGEALIGATVIISGTNYGSVTDLDGMFTLKKIPAGKYEIKISFVSYQTVVLNNITVEADQTFILNIGLKPAGLTTDEVVVTDKAATSYESALLNQQKKSYVIVDGLSAERIKRSPDATTADALKRLPGITVQDNKFVFVRGTSDRYSNAMLNNSPLASSEPDKKSFAFDLIPSNLIENTVVYKSFSPELPGDFSGGMVKINTTDFLTNPIFSVGYSTSFISGVSTKNFITYNTGKYDFLGFDDGTRALPDKFPADLSKISSRDSLAKMGRLLKNNWNTISTKALLNQSFSLSVGDNIPIFNELVSIIASYSYKYNMNITDVLRRDLEADGSDRYNFRGKNYTSNAFWGALLNIGYKIDDFNKISLRNSYTVNADDEVVLLEGYDKYYQAQQRSTGLRFVSRQLVSTQFAGESYLSFLNGAQLEYRYSHSFSDRDEPDYRRYYYTFDENRGEYYLSLSGQPTLKEGGRFFSYLQEYSNSYSIDLTLPVSPFKVKAGVYFEGKTRSFDSRLIGVVPSPTFTTFNILYNPIEIVLDSNNYRHNRFLVQEYVNGTNNYTTAQKVFAYYLLAEIPITIWGQSFAFIPGARLENSTQHLNTLEPNLTAELRTDYFYHDFLPSLNLIYRITEKINARISFNKTINRPEFREIAPFAYYDFQTVTTVIGNPSLKRATIDNYDFRFEYFPAPGELISLSLFQKNLTNAIEKVIPTGGTDNSRSFANAEKAFIRGFEIESRFSFGNLLKTLTPLFFSINYSWIESEVDEKNFIEGRKRRPLQGQSPYVFNTSISYDYSPTNSYFTLLYNRIGEKIIEVANFYREDIKERPRDVIDFVYTQTLYDVFEIKLTLKDILAQDQEMFIENEKIRSNSKHENISLGISYKIK